MNDEAFAAKLEASGVRCCLIGAVAMAIHGYVRATSDVDLLTTDAGVTTTIGSPGSYGSAMGLSTS